MASKPTEDEIRVGVFVCDCGLNIAGEYLRTDGEVGYVVVDVAGGTDDAAELRKDLLGIEGTVRARFLF